MSERWVVKRRHYDGGSSVIALVSYEGTARDMAAHRNAAYQSDTYYVEPWREQDAERPAPFWLTEQEINDE